VKTDLIGHICKFGEGRNRKAEDEIVAAEVEQLGLGTGIRSIRWPTILTSA
jgi:hypothetical protein